MDLPNGFTEMCFAKKWRRSWNALSNASSCKLCVIGWEVDE